MGFTNTNYLFKFDKYKRLTARLLLENLPNKNLQKVKRTYTIDIESLTNINFQVTDYDVPKKLINSKKIFKL
jgi:hypothetical protein